MSLRAWCFGGFLFPVAIWCVGFAFERQHPTSTAVFAGMTVEPFDLEVLIGALALIHVILSVAAMIRWSSRPAVWVSTLAQCACTFATWLLAVMAVNGTWL